MAPRVQHQSPSPSANFGGITCYVSMLTKKVKSWMPTRHSSGDDLLPSLDVAKRGCGACFGLKTFDARQRAAVIAMCVTGQSHAFASDETLPLPSGIRMFSASDPTRWIVVPGMGEVDLRWVGPEQQSTRARHHQKGCAGNGGKDRRHLQQVKMDFVVAADIYFGARFARSRRRWCRCRCWCYHH